MVLRIATEEYFDSLTRFEKHLPSGKDEPLGPYGGERRSIPNSAAAATELRSMFSYPKAAIGTTRPFFMVWFIPSSSLFCEDIFPFRIIWTAVYHPPITV